MPVEPTRAALVLATLLAVALGSPGCASKRRFTEEQARRILSDKPDELTPYYQRVVGDDEPSYVLHELNAAVASMALGHDDFARTSLDAAIAEIETIYAGADSAEEARGLFEEESSKNFKGEPYERMMAFYYRGLLYLASGDFQNARAAFKNAMLQDAIAEVASNRADAAFLAYLEGWASRCNGDDALARESFREAAALAPGTRPPDAGNDFLLVIERGSGPMKYATGDYQHELRFARGGSLSDAELIVREGDGETAWSRVQGDVYRQAATRGGREIDRILAGQVEYKDAAYGTADALSATATAASATALSVGRSAADVAGPLAIAGAGLQVASFAVDLVGDAINPEADTRYWANLPGYVELVTLRSRAGEARVSFLGADGLPREIHAIAARPPSGEASCKLAWLRSTAGRAHGFGRLLDGTFSRFTGTREGRLYGAGVGFR